MFRFTSTISLSSPSDGVIPLTWTPPSHSAYALPLSSSLLWPMALLGALYVKEAWCMVCEGISHFLHYLVDFFFCPLRQAQDCGQSLSVAVKLCQDLGFSVAPDKVVGPSTTLTFLGIELDSVSMVTRLLKPKLECLKASLSRWRGRSSARKRQLQSIIGQLSVLLLWFSLGGHFFDP